MWVFGYGSLLWNPGFEPIEQMRADLPGYRRSFCMLSIHHRGTPEDPGLVLALDAGRGERIFAPGWPYGWMSVRPSMCCKSCARGS